MRPGDRLLVFSTSKYHLDLTLSVQQITARLKNIHPVWSFPEWFQHRVDERIYTFGVGWDAEDRFKWVIPKWEDGTRKDFIFQKLIYMLRIIFKKSKIKPLCSYKMKTCQRLLLCISNEKIIEILKQVWSQRIANLCGGKEHWKEFHKWLQN